LDEQRKEDVPIVLQAGAFPFPVEATEQDKAVGRWGEEWAYKLLIRLLGDNWKVKWLNQDAESGDWYDIKAEPVAAHDDAEREAQTQYFEVKSTCSATKLHFDISARQVQKADMLGKRFTILRICSAGLQNARMRAYHNPKHLWAEKEKTGVSLRVHLNEP